MSGKLVLLLVMVSLKGMAWGANWDHAVDFNENFRLLWTVRGAEITMEIQAKTLGYVGVGFSEDGTLSGADMAIGWVDQGQPYFQVSSYTTTPLYSSLRKEKFLVKSEKKTKQERRHPLMCQKMRHQSITLA